MKEFYSNPPNIHHLDSTINILLYRIWFAGGSVVKNLPVSWRHRFHHWVRKVPCKRKWQPTPVCLFWKSHGQRSLRSQRIVYNLLTKEQQHSGFTTFPSI